MFLTEDLKVFGVTIAGIMASYIKLSPLDGFRYMVLAVTLFYTLHKWYIMNRDNKK